MLTPSEENETPSGLDATGSGLPPPLVEHCDEIALLRSQLQRKLFDGDIPVDLIFGPDTLDIPKRIVKFLSHPNPKNLNDEQDCVYLVSKKLGRKERRRQEMLKRQEETKKAEERQKIIPDEEMDIANFSSSSLEFEEENIGRRNSSLNTSTLSRSNLMSFKQRRALMKSARMSVDKHQRRAAKIFTRRQEKSHNDASSSDVSSAGYAVEPRRTDRERVHEYAEDRADFLESIQTNWQAGDLATVLSRLDFEKSSAAKRDNISSLKSVCDALLDQLFKDRFAHDMSESKLDEQPLGQPAGDIDKDSDSEREDESREQRRRFRGGPDSELVKTFVGVVNRKINKRIQEPGNISKTLADKVPVCNNAQTLVPRQQDR